MAEALAVPHQATDGVEPQWLEAAIMVSPAAIVLVRADQRIVFANRRAIALFGGRELVGRRLREALPELDAHGYLELADALLASGQQYHASEASLHLDRGHRGVEEGYFDFFLRPLRDPGGALGGLLIYAYEVTELVLARRQEEATREALHRVEERLRMAVAAAQLGLWHCELSTQTFIWDLHVAAHLGLDIDLVPSIERWIAAVHEEDRARVRQSMARAVSERTDLDVRFRTRDEEGRVRWVRAMGRTSYDGEGRPYHIDGITIDVTSAWHAEEERLKLLDNERAARAEAEGAQRRTKQLQAVTAALSQALTPAEVAAAVVQKGLVSLSAAGGAVLLVDGGRRHLEVVGGHGDLELEPLGAYARVPIAAPLPACDVVRTGKPIWLSDRGELVGRFPQLAGLAERLGVEACGAIPLSFEQRTIGALIFACRGRRALSDEERELLLAMSRQCAQALERSRLYEDAHAARAQAEAASRSKDEFLAMLGHELRNPLAPILTALQLMRLREVAGDTREVDVIERQVGHVIRLVDDLLDVSRITRGKVELKREPIELAPIVAKAIEMASPLLEQRAHRLTVHVPPTGLLLDADPVRLAQVFANLLTNAAKYTGAGGQIAVQAQRRGHRVVVRVRDSGQGIAPEILPHIFELFVQAQRTIERSQGGLGIGLTIVRSLVQLHEGTVTAFSEGVGLGSEFVVSLPARAQQVLALDAPRGESAAPVEGRGLRVLIVDDNVDAAELLGEALRAMGFLVRLAHDGPSALALAAEFQPELGLLDIGLPVMDGYELARHLRGRAELKRLRLVAITGYGQESDRRRSREAGFDEHLVKPVDLAQVRAICARAQGRAD